MTITPLTARARPSDPFWLVSESRLPQNPEQAKQHTSLVRIAGASLAMGVIRNLLRCNDASKRTKMLDTSSDVDPCRLSPTQVEGLRAALYFLRLYGDGLLRAEREGAGSER